MNGYVLAELRQGAETRDDPLEPEGHVCMTGDYALALVAAVEALRSLHAGLTCERDPMDVDERIARAGVVLANFDFGQPATEGAA